MTGREGPGLPGTHARGHHTARPPCSMSAQLASSLHSLGEGSMERATQEAVAGMSPTGDPLTRKSPLQREQGDGSHQAGSPSQLPLPCAKRFAPYVAVSKWVSGFWKGWHPPVPCPVPPHSVGSLIVAGMAASAEPLPRGVTRLWLAAPDMASRFKVSAACPTKSHSCGHLPELTYRPAGKKGWKVSSQGPGGP